jgi:hypothetical protein
VSLPAQGRRAVIGLLAGGGAAAALDILYAIVFYRLRNGVPATRILQSVAAGLLGRAAYEGGVATAALGLACHFLIALSWAGAYLLTADVVPALARRPIRYGLAYGLVVYAAMNFVVVPLSRFPHARSTAPEVVAGGILAHLFLIGLPIALAARWALPPRPRPGP